MAVCNLKKLFKLLVIENNAYCFFNTQRVKRSLKLCISGSVIWRNCIFNSSSPSFVLGKTSYVNGLGSLLIFLLQILVSIFTNMYVPGTAIILYNFFSVHTKPCEMLFMLWVMFLSIWCFIIDANVWFSFAQK